MKNEKDLKKKYNQNCKREEQCHKINFKYSHRLKSISSSNQSVPISVLTAINVLSIGCNQGVYKYKNIKRLFAKIEPEGLN